MLFRSALLPLTFCVHVCCRCRPGPAYGTLAVTEVAHVLLADGRSFVGSCDGDQWGAVEPSGSTLMRFATRLSAVLRVLYRAMVVV